MIIYLLVENPIILKSVLPMWYTLFRPPAIYPVITRPYLQIIRPKTLLIFIRVVPLLYLKNGLQLYRVEREGMYMELR